MMTSESMLSKRPFSKITVSLFFLFMLCSSQCLLYFEVSEIFFNVVSGAMHCERLFDFLVACLLVGEREYGSV